MEASSVSSTHHIIEYPDVSRYEKITDSVVVAASGEYADFQDICRRLRDLSNQTSLYDDDVKISGK